MKSRAYGLLVAFGIGCAVHTHLAAQQHSLQIEYTVKHFTPENGLGSVQTRGIVQDKQGFIWIGSRELVSRFDGYNFKVYEFDPKNLLKSSYTGGILSLHTDREKNLWIRSELFSKYDPKIDSFIHYKPNLQLSVVTRICFENDSRIVWFGTFNSGLYSFDTESGETKHFINKNYDSLGNVLSNSIRGISDRDSFLLIATLKGLWKFDKQRKIFNRPKCNPKDTTILYQKSIWEIFDVTNQNDNQTWIYPSGGLIRLDQNFNITQSFNFPPIFNSVMHTRDAQGVFLMGTRNGIFRYDPVDGSSGYLERGSTIARLANYIFVDREQNLWLGTESYGLYQISPSKIRFNHFNFDTPGTFTVGSVYQANGTDHLVLIRGEGHTNEMWTARPILSSAIDSVQFKKVSIDPPLQGFIVSTAMGKNKLWVCSWQSGITAFRVNPQSGLIETSDPKRFIADEKNPNAIRPLTGAVHEDKMQNLWLASRGHGISMLAGDKTYGSDSSVVHYLHNDLDTNSIGHNYAWQFLEEDEKSLWVINWSGVDLFRDARFEHVFNIEKPRSLLKLSEDTILIGTYNNGIYEAYKVRGKYILNKSPILTKYRALSMTTDNAGKLWMTDPIRNQLVYFDRQENIAIEFNANDNLPAGIGFISRTSKGMIVFASVMGFTVFDPLSLKISRAKTYPVLTQLKLNNEIPSIGENSKEIFAIKNDISVLDELLLDYQHNNFAIEFSAMEMTSPDKNLYRHKLEGYDKEWIETDWKERTATYTNLDAGHYVFRVRASNHHGIWSDHETSLAVRILPPPWQTWWAYTIYGLLFIGMFLYWRIYENKRLKLKHRAEHLSELDDLKSRFFANISHEFRTPITLILGPLKDLYNGTAKEDSKTVIGAVLRNGNRLLRLINQLLDLSKIEASKMQLHTSPIDLVEFLREIASSYESLAMDKKIKYFFYPEMQELVVYIDQEKIEKVVHNLLSNAFKFTKEGGEVILNLKADKNQCIITVKDAGIGIPIDQVDKVFDRFYQVDSSHTRGYEGSGLGMALAKELVELHHGQISVESKEGKGTTFTVSLPLGKEHLNKEEITDSASKKSEIFSDVVISEETRMEIRNENETVPFDSQPVLLIVEDNADMRHYIRKTLADQYQIIEAENGKQGVNKAEEIVPDLIISDIMMPEMDGYKLCEIIKTNELTSHIPVILLTAKADRESKLSGLEIGADDYLSKPFDSEELKLIVRNRIEERRKMRERFTREVTLEPKHISITSLDEKFLAKVLAIVETHMDNENFTIDELSREAAYSNMHFYRKIKALAGQTPSQFLRTIRLKRAAELLSKNSDNVTQIAYSVGFSSLSYFNKCFKEQFGVTPGQFAEAKSKV